jgi:hypothetical protein
MKNEHKIYAFFSAMALVATNYYFVAALYQKSGILKAYEPLSGVIWFNTVAWGAVALLFYKKIIQGERIKKVLFLYSFLQILFVLTVCLDRFVGILAGSGRESSPSVTRGLIYDVNTSARYTTNEFDFEIKTNSIGLRNEEIVPEETGRTRIVCLGDSWTMGWGVALDQSWPKIMERYLAENGYSIEVVNCGQGGQYTTMYKRCLEKILPLLKPRIVVVGVLQADDLAQLYEKHYPLPYQKTSDKIPYYQQLKVFISSAFQESYKNMILLGVRLNPQVPVDIHTIWCKQAREAMSDYSRLQAVRYETFDDTLKAMHERGDLNVSLMNYHMFFPERMLVFNDPRHKATQFALELMRRDIAEMKALCDRNQCTLVFANLPNNCFTGHRVVRNPITDSLFEDYLNTHNHIDLMYRDIAESSNMPYLEMTELFKNLQPRDNYFYLYDGHPTAAGYQVMGQTIGQYLITNHLLPEQRN